jgi:hypothetical protein
VVPSIIDPVTMYCDNNETLTQSTKPQSNQQTKHIIFHFIRQIIEMKNVKIEQVSAWNFFHKSSQ